MNRLGSRPAWLVGLLAFVVVVVVVLVPGVAAAAKPYGVVTVDLRPEIGEVPTHLCVVSQAQGPRTRETLGDLIVAASTASTSTASEAEAKPEGASSSTFELDAKLWSSAVDPNATCEAEGACTPRVELPLAVRSAEQLHVACTSDSLLSDRGARDPRVLVVMLEHLEGSPPSLESLKLTGGVATIGVGADLTRIVVTARSLGGHYDAHGRAFRAEEGEGANKLILLPIAPRCHGFDVELPGVRVRESDRDRLILRADGRLLDPGTCVGPLRGSSRMRLVLPRADDSGRLEVELALAEDERPTATRFAAAWDSAWPEGELVLDPHQIGFSWSPPACVWPAGTCPIATIEGGIECSATPLDDGTCQYLCPGASPREGETEVEWVELQPPLAVTFRKSDPDQRWTEILQRPGQTLASYVPADQIYLSGDISTWKTKVPGSGIDYVELLGSDGAKRRYALDEIESLRILAPGASCDPQRFRLIGERAFKEGSAEVHDGEVEFGPVHRTARLLTFDILLAQGGGIVLTGGGAPSELAKPVHFLVLGQLAANIRPRDPRFARVAYELRIGGTLGQWGYWGPGSLGDDPRRVTSKLAWVRLLFEPAVVVDVLPVLAVSAGFGVGGSWPIRASDQEITQRFSLVLSPSLDLRFTIRRWIALVLQGRMFLRERSVVATSIDQDQPVYTSFPNVSLVGLYGVELRF